MAKRSLRRCLFCGRAVFKEELLRVVYNKNQGKLVIDCLGKLGGRGVYLHPSAICVRGKSKLKPAQFARMLKLRSEVIDPIEFEYLLKEVLNWGSIV